MTALGDLRNAVATLLGDIDALPDAIAHPYIPARVRQDSFFLSPGDPYIESGETFGSVKVTLEITYVTPRATDDRVAPLLDLAVEETLIALITARYGVSQVSQPFALEANNAVYNAVQFTITKTIKL